jgi:hypothetical protein
MPSFTSVPGVEWPGVIWPGDAGNTGIPAGLVLVAGPVRLRWAVAGIQVRWLAGSAEWRWTAGGARG